MIARQLRLKKHDTLEKMVVSFPLEALFKQMEGILLVVYPSESSFFFPGFASLLNCQIGGRGMNH